LRKKSFEKWRNEIIEIYGNKYLYLDFLPLEITRRTHLKIMCPTHGEFHRTAGEILLGKGCPSCSKEKRVSTKFITTKADKIVKANKIHNHKYDYSNIGDNKIIGYKKYKIICPIHGEFEQVFDEHLRGRGCQKCSIEKSRNDPILDTINAKSIHSDKYSYELIPMVSPIRWSDKQKIICPTHGEFEQIWNNHVRGYGCPRCVKKQSSFELLIVDYLKSFYHKEIICSYRPDFLKGKELDIFIPDMNVAIEINGLYWHSDKFRDKWYHFDKWKLCNENNITLLTFYTDDLSDLKKRNIIFSKISHSLKNDIIIFARKCTLDSIEKNIAIDFCLENHLEGYNIPYKNSKYIGLSFNENLLMVAIYGEFYNQGKKSFEWKLQRICTKTGYTVVGGVSKISKYIKRDIGDFVFQITLDTGGSLLDRIITRNNISLRYWWTDGHRRISRNICQVGRISKNDDWNKNDTEDGYMRRKGYYRIYDTGIVSLEN
jgi:hypothetical protein